MVINYLQFSAVRKKNTVYIVGDIVLHPSLPNGYCLACSIAGTSSNDELIFDTLIAGSQIVDNTITWTILSFIPNLYYIPQNQNDFNTEMVSGFYFFNSKENAPINDDKGRWFNINLSSKGPKKEDWGYSSQIVTQVNWPLGPRMYFRNKYSKIWTDWERIITDKNSGYRWPNTSYAVGQIAYHSSLPTGRYLECTTGGTTDSGELVISNTTIGGTIIDGSVTWTIRALSALFKIHGVTNEVLDDVNTVITNGLYSVKPQTINMPESVFGTLLVLRENSLYQFFMPATGGTNDNGTLYYRHQKYSGEFSPWKQQEAITTKLFGQVSYITYASGMIIQCGQKYTQNGTDSVSFPISFSNTNYGLSIVADGAAATYSHSKDLTINNFIVVKGTASSGIRWVAIGY